MGRLLRLADDGGTYEFCYVRGALEARERGFAPFVGLGGLDEVVYSRELPPLFANRVMRSGRPDYAGYVGRLGLTPPADPRAILARSGGPRQTDSVEVFAEAERLEDGRWEAVFFVRGVRHVEGGEAAAALQPGDHLSAQPEPHNPEDPRATLLLTQASRVLGYCPHYLVDELGQRLDEDPDARFTVLQVNPPPAPAHYRVLAKLQLRTTDGLPPFRSQRLEPLAARATVLDGGRKRRVA